MANVTIIWDKILKNGPSKTCERQPLKKFTWHILEFFILDDQKRKLTLNGLTKMNLWNTAVSFCANF